MTRTLKAGIAGLLLAAAAAAPASAATVGVRVEGQASTLLPRTAVTPPDAPEPHGGCAPDSAANALDTAVGGNWDGQAYTQTVLGESHTFSDSDYWGLWVFRGGRYVVANGLCSELLAAGEELLVAYQQAPAPDYAPRYFPLGLDGVPATVAPGAPFTVTVRQTACDTAACNPGEGHAVTRPGATVAAGDVAATSGADGTATLTLAERGPATLRATAPGATPTASEVVCVTDGADGYCGTTAGGSPAPVTTPVPCATTGDDGLCGTRDTRPAHATITGLGEGRRYRRARAPRELTATVAADASGLSAVKLGLSRSHRGRCWTLSGRQERFRAARCGHHANFVVGDAASVSYLLPQRLGPGRYVLDVVAIDGAGNRDPLARGRNRVVFTVK